MPRKQPKAQPTAQPASLQTIANEVRGLLVSLEAPELFKRAVLDESGLSGQARQLADRFHWEISAACRRFALGIANGGYIKDSEAVLIAETALDMVLEGSRAAGRGITAIQRLARQASAAA